MRISVRHELRFSAGEGTSHAVQHLLATPRDTPAQKVVEWTISMPGMDGAAVFDDAFGNVAHMVSQSQNDEALFIAISGIVDTKDCNGVLGKLETDPNIALFKRTTAQTRPNGHLVNRLKAQQKAGSSRVDMFHWLMKVLHDANAPDEGEDDDTPEIAAEDHAHVFVAALRGMDVPARFVTGYVLSDVSAPARLHCWAEAWDDGLGWIGFDPSDNLCPTPNYVRLAAGLDADTTALVRLVPNVPRAADDAIRLSQDMMANQQQQQQAISI